MERLCLNSFYNMVTIFTPSYNRAYILPKLYESLCIQTSKDFEWLIVDDGSIDNTENIIQDYIKDQKIKIRYFKQINGGKHRAINRGLKEAKGNLFFIVDSDDWLTSNAVDWILKTAKEIMHDNRFAGISGTRIFPNGHKIGGDDDFGIIDANAIEIRTKHFVAGDLAEIFKTEILRKYPFPEFDGEKFCPEALIWNRIAKKYKLRYVNCGIYVCEYLSDGLTASIIKQRRNSPIASMTYYSEFYNSVIPLRIKLRSAINFHRFSPNLSIKEYNMGNLISILMLLPGKLMRLNDRKKIR